MPALQISDNWRGFDSLRFLVIFGDSFSSVGYSAGSSNPSADEPLGIVFPGETSCERLDEVTQQTVHDPNWVGHLVRSVNAQRPDKALLVYDYAIPGDTVARMKIKQVGKEFLPHVGSHPAWAPWTASDTLFLTWIGINDCTWNLHLQAPSAQACLDDLFAAQEKLYQAGARNFCFVDVPPAHTLPKGPKTPRAKAAYESWNPLLRSGAEAFSAAHPDATVLLFSSWDLFTRVLSDPLAAGVAHEAATRAALFADGFLPSSAMHAVIAREILAFLKSQPAAGSSSLSSQDATANR
ncbi:uncharacterized protein TRAVEDRAFT_28408 [Trametes versicolor FP-101664 SS1]|uniref:uncharacterized protein n=1 Tax=Trametes versicolor (strain FP-101664) TaxID=717944 RepID=UPI00046236E7|nr:uncharacterized protein TRAVEDRAFT_28408 [Trametes versicolor FP-101664 SS1]EIW61098.1 hypothetical protein TRAVEDRAFT_28408 [Trametes versicolor FP-101664 SS1]